MLLHDAKECLCPKIMAKLFRRVRYIRSRVRISWVAKTDLERCVIWKTIGDSLVVELNVWKMHSLTRVWSFWENFPLNRLRSKFKRQKNSIKQIVFVISKFQEKEKAIILNIKHTHSTTEFRTISRYEGNYWTAKTHPL